MSRIGRLPIALPSGVDLKVDGTTAHCKGPKGALTQHVPAGMTITIGNGVCTIERPSDDRHDRARHGLVRALLSNMVTGVTEGYTKVLEIQGVGYRAELKGKNLELALGYSHGITVEPPAGISFAVERSLVTVSGIDKQVVGETAARIRRLRPPEPYKGKGIRYQGEQVRRKAGKTGAA